MNTGKKHFDPARRNGAAGTREVSKGGSGKACLWHTILLARSSVLYLLFREAGKGGDVALPDSTPLPAENGSQKMRRDEQSMAAVFMKEARAKCNEAHASGGTRGI